MTEDIDVKLAENREKMLDPANSAWERRKLCEESISLLSKKVVAASPVSNARRIL